MLPFLFSLLLALPAAPSTSTPALVTETTAMTLRGDWDAAVARLEPAIQAATARRDRNDEAVLRTELGRVLADRNFFHQADPVRAREALQQALRVARAARHQASVADVTQYLGQLVYSESFRTGNWQAPRAYFRRAIDLRSRIGDRRALAQSYFYLGLTYEQDLQPVRAERWYRRSLALAEATGDKVQQSYAHRHIGGLHDERHELEAAHYHIAQSVALRREGGFSVGVPYALLHLSDFVLRQQGRRDEAIRLVEEAIDLAERAHSTRALSAAQSALAELELADDHAPLAVSYLSCALDNARAYGDPIVVRDTEQKLQRARKAN